jgi:putative membrane protein
VISAQAGAGTAADRAAASPQLNDAQIAGVSLAANNGEVEQNMIATTKATTPDLRAFASDMVAMHTAASARETALAATLMVTPQDSPVTQMLQSMSQETVAMLNGLDGSEFDAVYVKSQVDAHEQVLMLVVGTLLPQAQAPELRDELTAMRETVMGHLDRARSLGESTSVNP